MLKFFRITAFLEGISLLVLFFIAMPLKYIFDNPSFIRPVGMAHGVLFIGYIGMAILMKVEQKWELKKLGIVCLASVVPLGTFYVEKKYLNNAKNG